MEFINKNTIKLDKEINELDKFVLDFCRILEKHTKYMIVSGYVAILFGRSRGTEDVDIFIKKLDKKAFDKLFEELETKGYGCITAPKKGAFDNLNDDIPIRFARKNQFIPNIELKFAKNPLDVEFLNDPLTVILPTGEIKISFIEPQIAFKEVCLGSEKDIEDALHLRKIFKERIDEDKVGHYKEIFSK